MQAKSKILSFAIGMCLASAASATNGYFSHGFSLRDSALGGAGVAHSQDTLSAATNPASMLDVGDGWDVGVTVFSPNRNYTTSGGPAIPGMTGVLMGGGLGPDSSCAAPGTMPCQLPFSVGPQSIDSENTAFPLPSFGWNKKINEKMSFGISVYGNGGMNTEYEGGSATLYNPFADAIGPAPGTFGAGTAGVDLMQLFVAPTIAYKVSDTTSIGASVIFAYQLFEAQGLQNFMAISTNPGALSNNGHDNSYGFGLKLGFKSDLSEKFSIGASYQSKIDMEELDSYSGLFAEAGDFDIPSTWTVGVAFHPNEDSSLLLDVQRINYSDTASVSNPMMPLLDGRCFDMLNSYLFTGQMMASGPGCLGGSEGAGFGWEDMTVYKLGYEWKSSTDMTWRVGFSTTEQPIGESEVLFNILAPGVMEQHYTAGFSKVMSDNSELTVAAMYAPEVEVTGGSPFDPTQTVTLSMYQWSLGVGYTYRY